MKSGIHPQYFSDASATCACGASYQVGSTVQSFRVEICSACHPFYTGQEKVLDATGRVDRFKKRAAIAKKA